MGMEMDQRGIQIFGVVVALAGAMMLALHGCKPAANTSGRPDSALIFPAANRPVPETSGTQFSTEVIRDEAGEARKVMDWAAITPGMTVADIGAGEGYYTVRLAVRVGTKGRVLAQDINRGALERLGLRIDRERLDNVAIKEGAIDDARLPDGSFDRVFMVHMFHEVTEPYALLWRMWPALNKGGQVIVVDRDLPGSEHGLDPKILFCEFEATGYKLLEFAEQPEVGGYFARFAATGVRPKPEKIKRCGKQ
jgi:ubiquinone/menaquinone biosynthesis C-methylase UbiE